MPPPKKPRPVAPLRNRQIITQKTALVKKATEAAASRPAKRACPNPQCSSPKVEDGICHNCGWVVDDSNIVSEITFGENSSGAPVVQGSFLGADQGFSNNMGPAFGRVGNENTRDSTVREGKFVLSCGEVIG